MKATLTWFELDALINSAREELGDEAVKELTDLIMETDEDSIFEITPTTKQENQNE